MKLSITLILVFLLCSCEKEKEVKGKLVDFEQTDPNVFEFKNETPTPHKDTSLDLVSDLEKKELNGKRLLISSLPIPKRTIVLITFSKKNLK